MKKISLILSFAFFGMLAMSSCKKDYTCECIDTTDKLVTKKMTITDKKKDAEKACDKEDNPTFDINCSIK